MALRHNAIAAAFSTIAVLTRARKGHTMVTEQHREQFRTDGYFILANAFSAPEIDALRERIDDFAAAHEAHLQQQGASGISRPNEISFTAHLAEQDPSIWSFVTQPMLVKLATTLIGPDIALYWDQSVYKKPETRRPFPWHQDTGYIQVEPQEYVTCWLALDDATVENGCIWIMPGSHRQGLVEHQDTPIGKQCYFGDDPGTSVPLNKGGVAVFSSLLFHRSGPNTSDGERKAYIVQYSAADVRDGTTGQPLGKPVIARAGKPV